MLESIKRIFAAAGRMARSRGAAAAALSVAAAFTIVTVGAAAQTVAIYDGEQVQTIRTFSCDPEAILRQAGVEYAEDDLITMDTADGFPAVTLTRAFDVTVTKGAETYAYRTTGGTVADALAALDIAVDEHDMVSADLSDTLTEDMYIDVISVDYETVTEEVPISFESTTEYTAELAEGETQVSAGEKGVKLVTYRNKLVNGKLAESTAVTETVVKEPVHQKTLVGTKTEEPEPEIQAEEAAAASYDDGVFTSADLDTVSTLQPDSPIALDASGRPVNYSRLITGKATAYTAPIGSATSTGRGARTGYVAVNPKQIPYGSRLFIRTTDGSYIYGYAVAADTGGFVKKGRITVDLFFNTEGECRNFGVRNVEIYVLD